MLLLVANRKVHMRFRLAPSSMTLDVLVLELYKFEFSENFAGFRRFPTQQQLNE